MAASHRSEFRNRLEAALAWLVLKSLGLLPRPAAIRVGESISRIAYIAAAKLRRVGYRNLELALPEISVAERARIIRSVFRCIGRQLGEFSQFPKLDPETIDHLVEYDGFENYERAAAAGRGVLFLTGHFGAWELCAFSHGLHGHPLNFLVRPLDNPLLDRLITRYRCLSGNRVIDKNDAVKHVLRALGRGEAVGFLIDVNTLPDQGIFCDFFGLPACTTTGLATFALRTGAPVVPGFLLWDNSLKKYRLRFEPELTLSKTGDLKEDVAGATAAFTRVIEAYARKYPDQWLWIHKRWKTRPPGSGDLYGRAANSPSVPGSSWASRAKPSG